jgi:methylenetetrahydrofolate dehydrogenase (NADP+)/methenyltetrahydrofolate cyclohydrolase
LSAAVIDGRAIAARIRAETAEEGRRLAEATGIVPGLAAVLVGNDPASATYVKMKGRACGEAGFHSRILRLPEETSETELLGLVTDLNLDPAIHGILVQLPLPPKIDADRVMSAVDPAKDVDGFHPINVGRLVAGDLGAGFVPATPAGILRLLRETGIDPTGAEAVVVGRSDIVGKPVALLLLHAHATVTICHSRTADLATHTHRGDILVAAVGRPGLVTGSMVKPGAAVIDVGTNRVPNPDGDGYRLVGDVDFDSVAKVAGHLTPVPGGVGPMTIAMLLVNTLEAALRVAARNRAVVRST